MKISTRDDYLTEVRLLNTKNHKVFYEKLTYYYIEMPKFKKTETELSNHLEYWLYYLNHLAESNAIPKTLKKDKIIREAFDVAEFLALSKDQQFSYQLDLKAKLDYKNVLAFAKEQAKKEGVKEGIEKNKKEIAKSLLDILEVSVIAEKTGLSIAEIEALKLG